MPAQNLQRRGSVEINAASFSGPIPPPELLKQYDEIIPNGANRIVTMAEKQSSHRIGLERTVIRGDSIRAYLGLFTGFVFGVFAFYLSYRLIMAGHDKAGVILATTDVVSLVGTFVYGTRSRKQERERRDEKNRALVKRK